MPAEVCSGCGLAIASGAAACQALADGMWARDFSEPVRYFKWHRLNVDCYALQHPDRYCVSAKSLLAHLCGLCIAAEHGNDQALLRGLQLSLNGNPAVARPDCPAQRGSLTIADVCHLDDPAEYSAAVQRWAASVWLAYAPLHGDAHEWLARL